MALPKELTTVTPLSKYLAMVLFILLPFVGFYLGIKYEQSLSISSHDSVINTTEKSTTWKTYTNQSYNYSISIPSDWEIVESMATKAVVSFKPKGSQTALIVTAQTNQNDFTLNTWVSDHLNFKTKTMIKTKINTYDAILVPDLFVNDNTYKSYFIKNVKNKTYYGIEVINYNKYVSKINSQILSIFKFTN